MGLSLEKLEKRSQSTPDSKGFISRIWLKCSQSTPNLRSSTAHRDSLAVTEASAETSRNQGGSYGESKGENGRGSQPSVAVKEIPSGLGAENDRVIKALPEICVPEQYVHWNQDASGEYMYFDKKAADIIIQVVKNEARPNQKSPRSARSPTRFPEWNGRGIKSGRYLWIRKMPLCDECLHWDWKGSGQLRIDKHCTTGIIRSLEIVTDKNDADCRDAELLSSYPQHGHIPLKENGSLDVFKNHVINGGHTWFKKRNFQRTKLVIDVQRSQDLMMARTLIYGLHDDPKVHDPLIKFCEGRKLGDSDWSKVRGLSSLLRRDLLSSVMAGTVDGCSEAELRALLNVTRQLLKTIPQRMAQRSENDYCEPCKKCCKLDEIDIDSYMKTVKGKDMIEDLSRLRDVKDKRIEDLTLQKEGVGNVVELLKKKNDVRLENERLEKERLERERIERETPGKLQREKDRIVKEEARLAKELQILNTAIQTYDKYGGPGCWKVDAGSPERERLQRLSNKKEKERLKKEEEIKEKEEEIKKEGELEKEKEMCKASDIEESSRGTKRPLSSEEFAGHRKSLYQRFRLH